MPLLNTTGVRYTSELGGLMDVLLEPGIRTRNFWVSSHTTPSPICLYLSMKRFDERLRFNQTAKNSKLNILWLSYLRVPDQHKTAAIKKQICITVLETMAVFLHRHFVCRSFFSDLVHFIPLKYRTM